MNSQQFADNFIMQNANKLPTEKTYLLKEKLKTLPESRQSSVQSVPLKDPMITILLSLFLGGLGVDRFYIGDIGLGILKFVSVIFLVGVIWALIDIFLCYKKTKDVNFDKLMLVS